VASRGESIGPNHASSRFIETEGLRWHIQQAGQGPALLLLHGAASSIHTWRGLMPLLSRHFTVLAVDLPGHGQSGLVSIPRSSIVGVSNLLADLLAKIHVDPVVVIGHSAGAVILCNMALSRQINPRILVSINGAFVPLLGTAGIPISRLATRSRGEFLPRLIAKRALDRANVTRLIEATGSHLDEAGVDCYAQLLQQPTHVEGALRLMSQWDLASVRAQLRAVSQPLALLVAGKDKAISLQHALSVMEHVKHTTLYPLPDLGHLAHEERPDIVGDKILQIISPYMLNDREALVSL
jgi:magnesium chelatase accessory protein